MGFLPDRDGKDQKQNPARKPTSNWLLLILHCDWFMQGLSDLTARGIRSEIMIRFNETVLSTSIN